MNNSGYNPFGNSAIKEISINKGAESFFLLEPNEYNIEKIRITDLNICLTFFDIMIRAAIYQYNLLLKEAEREGRKIEIWHLWLHYLRIIADKVIENFEYVPIEMNFNDNGDEPTYYHYFLYKIISILTDWVIVSDKLKSSVLIIDICRCLGGCLHSIAKAACLSGIFKRKCFDNVLETYFHIAQMGAENQEVVDSMKNIFIKHWYLNQRLDWHHDQHFLSALKDTWSNEFDKVPFEGLGVYDEFIKDILSPLDIR